MSGVGTAAASAGNPRGDARLVERVREGDDGAFEELYRRYQRRIRNFVTSRVGDPARAEDVTQEAFISALRGLRASDAEIALKPWLYEIARNATIDFHRRHRRNEELSVDREELMLPLDRLRLVSSRVPETELDMKERLDHLRGALDELPPNHHRVLVMREFEGLSYREIAERLDVTHAAVESKLFRARRRLKHEYDELAAGRRCSTVRATIALMAEGVEPRQERRRVARHARRCSACRRHARELGVDPFGRRPWQSRAAAFPPFAWLVRRSPAGPAQQGEMLLGNGGHLAEQGVALVTAAALACACSLSLGSASRPTPAVPKPVVAPAAPKSSSLPSGVTGARLRGRSAVPKSSPGRAEQRRARPRMPTKAPPAPVKPPAPQATSRPAKGQGEPAPPDGSPVGKLPNLVRPVPAVASLAVQAPSTAAGTDVLEPPTLRPLVQAKARVAETLARALPG
jgi:RNA polymerase sigma factor (sigma-70 family)